MKDFKIKLSVVSLGVVFFLGSAQAAITGSMHDLSTGGPGGGVGATGEICVFCHTPHGADTGASAPLWNKVLPLASTFNTYNNLNTATLDGTIDLNAGGISLACLSCHDGTAALDLVLNAPTVAQGTYRYDAAGANLGAGVTMVDFVAGDPLKAGAPVPVLGQDLRDDHPVGVQYAGGGLLWADITGGNTVANAANDKLFNEPSWSNNRLWIGTVAETGTEGSSRLPLYNGTLLGLGPMVECATCHNPHVTANGSFLRMSNVGSALCLACHIK